MAWKEQVSKSSGLLQSHKCHSIIYQLWPHRKWNHFRDTEAPAELRLGELKEPRMQVCFKVRKSQTFHLAIFYHKSISYNVTKHSHLETRARNSSQHCLAMDPSKTWKASIVFSYNHFNSHTSNTWGQCKVACKQIKQHRMIAFILSRSRY